MFRKRRSRRRRRKQNDNLGMLALVALAFVGWATTDQGQTFLRIGAVVLAATLIVALIVILIRNFAGVSFKRNPKIYSIEDLRALSPLDFEHKTAKMLKQEGFKNVRVDGGAGDLQADVTATSPKGQSVIIQCKRYAEGNKVTSGEIQSFIGMAYVHHRADKGMYVTTSEYTRNARELGEKHGIVLIDQHNILDGLGKEVKQAKLV